MNDSYDKPSDKLGKSAASRKILFVKLKAKILTNDPLTKRVSNSGIAIESLNARQA